MGASNILGRTILQYRDSGLKFPAAFVIHLILALGPQDDCDLCNQQPLAICLREEEDQITIQSASNKGDFKYVQDSWFTASEQ